MRLAPPFKCILSPELGKQLFLSTLLGAVFHNFSMTRPHVAIIPVPYIWYFLASLAELLSPQHIIINNRINVFFQDKSKHFVVFLLSVYLSWVRIHREVRVLDFLVKKETLEFSALLAPLGLLVLQRRWFNLRMDQPCSTYPDLRDRQDYQAY